MKPFRSLLVDIDATASAHPALDRAIRLAKKSGAKLTVADVLTVPSYASRYLPAGIEESIVLDRRQQLGHVARAVREVQAEPKLLVGRPATALIEEVLRSNHDLIIRSHARDLTTSGPRPFGAVEWNSCGSALAPCCSCVTDSPPQNRGLRVLSTPVLRIPTHRALNAKIVELALLMADCLESDSPTLFRLGAICRRSRSPSRCG
jgi:nucleotide-binding universal stress UspA family protein